MMNEKENDNQNLTDKLDLIEDEVRAVKVDRPFLLSNSLTLREYQHFGLSWLVSLHERRLNGILADEMGLGKTIQTISLLAYLACYRGIWGPHLIVVPSSCVVNWESEFKKWCPGFKIMTYYGSAKARKNLRVGWSKLNSFHICITSYQLVVQDAPVFRRKQWYYMILDEAHNIKNFKSQRWQTLLNFNSQRRLLLTGTPLQNNLMELWSLMHFLMPHIFRSRKEFSYWFSNPLSSMVEGNKSVNNDLVSRLHSIMRPFLLRRLKKDVEKQLPGKYEHIITCKLSKRQLYLYEDFMSRSSTRSSLSGGNYLGMMNILMQLRKVCNHPDLFEPRPIISPFVSEPLTYAPPRILLNITEKHPLECVTHSTLVNVWGHSWYDYDMHWKSELETKKLFPNTYFNYQLVHAYGMQKKKSEAGVEVAAISAHSIRFVSKEQYVAHVTHWTEQENRSDMNIESFEGPHKKARIEYNTMNSFQKQSLFIQDPDLFIKNIPKYREYYHKMEKNRLVRLNNRMELCFDVSNWRCTRPVLAYFIPKLACFDGSVSTRIYKTASKSQKEIVHNEQETHDPFILEDFEEKTAYISKHLLFTDKVNASRNNARIRQGLSSAWYGLIFDVDDVAASMHDMITNFVFVLPKTTAAKSIQLITVDPKYKADMSARETLYYKLKPIYKKYLKPFYPATIRQQIFFPDRKLIQFDSGKLQRLDILLRERKQGGHKCLIFTQMSKMLDILEIFLNLHGHTYVRLDGSTNLDRRQKLMDRFNTDEKLFCFLLSTRSGGLGINLTGADSVIFYDSDWNPAMDAQAQDRAHRIGQTREVHIYRFVSGSTIEENILTKARQKRHLDHLVMTEGNFSEDSLFSADGLKGILGVDEQGSSSSDATSSDKKSTNGASDSKSSTAGDTKAIAEAMAAVEDEEDIQACKGAVEELKKEQIEFDESVPLPPSGEGESDGTGAITASDGSSSTSVVNTEEADAEKEFNSWQASVGPDFNSLQAALKPIERYALQHRTVAEPYYSIHFLSEQEKLEAMKASGALNAAGEEWDVEEIEMEKERQEMKLLTEGELLYTGAYPKAITSNSNSNGSVSVGVQQRLPTGRELKKLHEWYIKERGIKKQERKRRILSGDAWTEYIDDKTGFPFWYNKDTGESTAYKPAILVAREEIVLARKLKYGGLPMTILLHVFSFLDPHPDRYHASLSCKKWQLAFQDHCFEFTVLPVESGMKDNAERLGKLKTNEFTSIKDAIDASTAGQVIKIGSGHHWETEPIAIKHPIKLLSEGGESSRCIIELATNSSLNIETSKGLVYISGVTLRRARRINKPCNCIRIVNSKCFVYSSTVDNEGAPGPCIYAGHGGHLSLLNCSVKHGHYAGILTMNARVILSFCNIHNNHGHGVLSTLESDVLINETYIQYNAYSGLCCVGNTVVKAEYSDFSSNSPSPTADVKNVSRLILREENKSHDHKKLENPVKQLPATPLPLHPRNRKWNPMNILIEDTSYLSVGKGCVGL